MVSRVKVGPGAVGQVVGMAGVAETENATLAVETEGVEVSRILYDKAAAAEQLSTSPRRVDELRRAGQLIAVVDGGQYKYTATDLQRYVDGLKTSAEASAEAS
jgi:hypothetical protein